MNLSHLVMHHPDSDRIIKIVNPANVLGYYLARATDHPGVWCVCCVEHPIKVVPRCHLLSIHDGKADAIFEYAVVTVLWYRHHGTVHRLPEVVSMDVNKGSEPPWPTWLAKHLNKTLQPHVMTDC